MTERRYTPEMAVDLRVPGDLRLSPDGRWLAFRVEPIGHRDKERTSTLYVTPTDGSILPRPLTGSDANHTLPVWSPDGGAIAFLADRAKRGTAQLYVVASSGGEATRLTDLAGGVGNIAWSPDGTALFYTARRRSLAGEPDPDSDIKVASERWHPQAIARVPALGGAPHVIGPAEGHVWTFAVSDDGRQVAALVSDTDDLAGLWDNVRLEVFPVSGGPSREVLRLSSFPTRPAWSPDGRFIALVGSRLPDVDPTHVYVVDVASGDVTTLDERGMTPTWVAFDGDALLVLSVDKQVTRIDRTDVRGSEWERVELGAELDACWIESDPRIDARAGLLALSCATPQRPADLYVAAPGSEPVRLTMLNPQLEEVRLAEMEWISWESVGGETIHGWLLLPPDASSGARLPLIAAIHGGPSWQWGNWFHGTWHDWGQLLAAAGYAVFMPNPRGSTGRGGAFTGANRFDFGGGDFEDILSGIDRLIARGVADSERLGICGWSYGGFMVAWAVTHSTRFKAAVAGAAPTNWVSKIGTTDIRPFNEWNIGEVNAEPDRVWERSPIRYVANVTTPTLLVHGEADQRVPVTQATEFYLALKAKGIDTDLVSYPRQGHAFHERAHQLDLLQRLIGWFERYIGTG
jgi:dipeptidyl aminopeptidase/acylaminoacyl peptidase